MTSHVSDVARPLSSDAAEKIDDGTTRVAVQMDPIASINPLGDSTFALLLEAQYDTTSGQLIGRGRLSISIEICWCFTLEINEEVTYTVGQGNQSSGRLQGDISSFVAGNGDRKHLAFFLPPPAPTHQSLVKDYVNMLA